VNIAILPWVAAFIHLVAFGLYIKRTLGGRNKPVATSWGIRAFRATLIAVTFRDMTDTLSALQFIVGSVGCIVVFSVLVFLGELKKMDGRQWTVLVIGIFAIVMWKLTTAEVANTILIASVIWTFGPTITSARKEPTSEWWIPWAMWTMSTMLTFSYIFFATGNTFALVMPCTLILGNGMTCFYLIRGRK